MGNPVQGKAMMGVYFTHETREALRQTAFDRRESQSEIVERATRKELQQMNQDSYRAAIWKRHDGQGEVRLTDRAQSGMTDEELLSEGRAEAFGQGMGPDGGEIVVAEWSGR